MPRLIDRRCPRRVSLPSDENLPIVAITTHTPVYDKVVSNLQEAKARDGKLIVICDEGDEEVRKMSDDIIEIPWTIEPLQPILSVIPTRNLAKSVTVE